MTNKPKGRFYWQILTEQNRDLLKGTETHKPLQIGRLRDRKLLAFAIWTGIENPAREFAL